MKRQFCVLLIGLTLSLTASAGGYYPAYGNYGYARAHPSYGFQEHRNDHTLTAVAVGAEMAGESIMNMADRVGKR